MEVRRYSSDLEIITTVTETRVREWMRSQSLKAEPVHAAAIKCALTPDGTLFVIHSYPQDDFDAADITPHPFEHFPITRTRPPGKVEARLISAPYLLATKLWEVQRLGRGGERPKDAYDLAQCLSLAPTRDIFAKLETYVRHQGHGGRARDVARRAACYLDWYSAAGSKTFVTWSKRFIRADGPQPKPEDLHAAASLLAKELGFAPMFTEAEICEILIRELSPKDLTPIAKTLGCAPKTLSQYDNMREFVLVKLQPRLTAPYPMDAQDLLAKFRELAG